MVLLGLYNQVGNTSENKHICLYDINILTVGHLGQEAQHISSISPECL